MWKAAFALASVLCLLRCEDRGGAELVAEIAVPSGTIIQSIDLVTPESMSGDGAPKTIRRENGRDVYRLSCIAFFHERERFLVVETENHVAAVVKLPGGRVGARKFTSWVAPEFFIRSEDPTWSVMHGDTSGRLPGLRGFRVRYSFADWHSTLN